MEEIKFSIIVPIYNTEKYLKQCLDSIVNQTYRNLEIILVHDKTEDASGEITDSYGEKDDRIIVVHREKGDVSSARNIGLDLATGDYMVFVDSDDWMELNYCEEMFHMIISFGDADIIKTDYFIEAEKTYLIKLFTDNVFDKNTIREKTLFLLNVFSRYYDESYYSELNNWEAILGNVWAGVYHRDTVAGLRFYGTKCEDLLFNGYAVMNSSSDKIRYWPKALYHYRQNLDSAVTRYNPSRIEEYSSFYEHCFRLKEEFHLDERFTSCLSRLMVNQLNVNIKYTIVHPDSPYSFWEKRKQLEQLMGLVYYKSLPYKTKRTRDFSAKTKCILILLHFKFYGTVICLAKLQWKMKACRKKREIQEDGEIDK